MGRIAIDMGGDVLPLERTPATAPQTAPFVQPASATIKSDRPAQPDDGPSDTPSKLAPLPPNDTKPSGIDEVPVKSGDTIWSIYRQLGLFKDWNQTDATIAKNLPATPWLDPTAFGNRTANPPDALKHMPLGSTVTVLDGKRLDFLAQERAALQSYDSIRGPILKLYDPDERQAAFDAIVAPIQSEFEYTTLGMPVPSQADLDHIADGIRQRAPNDPNLQAAVDEALSNVKDELQQWGRTPDQLGKVMSDATAGDVPQLAADMQKQLVDIGRATLSSTNGDAAQAETAMRAREGVYMTYLGTQNAAVVTKALDAADQQLFVDEPAQRITQAYNDAYAKGGKDAAANAAAAAAHQLRLETDPATKLPGKVALISASPQVQAIMQKIAQSIGDGMHSHTGAPPPKPYSTMLMDFSAAMQNTFDSDDPALGMSEGKDTVDKMAGYLADAIDQGAKPGDNPLSAQGRWLSGVLSRGLSEDGSAALPAALTARANATGNAALADAGNAALAGGIDAYKSTKLTPLQEKAAKILVPIERGPDKKEWGGLQTQADKDATVQKLQKGLLASDLTDIVDGQTNAMQYYAKFKGVLDRYGNALHGEGYDSGFRNNVFWTSTSDSVTGTVSAFEKAAGFDAAKIKAGQIPFTQFWWQSRVATGSLKFVAKQSAKQALLNASTSSADDSNLLKKVFGAARDGTPRTLTGLMSGLFYSNSLVTADAAQQDTSPNKLVNAAYKLDNAGFTVLYDTLSASQLADFVAPDWKKSVFGAMKVKEGAKEVEVAATPQRRILEAALARMDTAALSDSGKRLLSTSLKQAARRTLLSGTSDLAGGLVAWAGLAPMFFDPNPVNPGHEFAYATAGVADLGTYAARSLLQSGVTLTAEDIAGETLAGLTVDGWTGVGFVLNLAAAGVQFLANQDDIVHLADPVSKYLVAQGVPPDIAGPFARHMMNSGFGATSAGPALTAYFRAKGKTNADMIAWMKTVKTGGDADTIATYFKEMDIYHHDKDGNAVLEPQQVAWTDDFLDKQIGASGFQPGAQIHP